MSIRMEKPWQELNTENINPLQGQLGVYQIANAEKEIISINYTGGRSLFGLRGDLLDLLEKNPAGAVYFRYEVNMQYMTRHEELLMIHVADFGSLPPGNQKTRKRKLGTLSID
ncbi:MAG: hypothetical protein JKX83_04180 [Pseudomonadales bacterium]|nr:hypothetical protein [Pseudomonadales bacterium]